MKIKLPIQTKEIVNGELVKKQSVWFWYKFSKSN